MVARPCHPFELGKILIRKLIQTLYVLALGQISAHI